MISDQHAGKDASRFDIGFFSYISCYKGKECDIEESENKYFMSPKSFRT